SGVDGRVNAIAVQPDGKVVIGGGFSTVKGGLRTSIARLNADGSLDNSFDPGSGANGGVNAVALQPDGRLIIAGGFTTVNGIARKFVARLNADGSVDSSFDPGAVSAGVSSMALQPDGKQLVRDHECGRRKHTLCYGPTAR